MFNNMILRGSDQRIDRFNHLVVELAIDKQTNNLNQISIALLIGASNVKTLKNPKTLPVVAV